MKRFKSHLTMIILIVSLVVLAACSQTSETTPTLTVEPTTTTAPSEPEIEIKEVVEKVIIPDEVVVENFIVNKRDEATDEIEIVVQGYLRNTCTEIEDVSVSREGELLVVDIQTKITSEETCEEGNIQFQKVVKLDVGDLEPGTYLITKGPVEKYIVQNAPSAEEAVEADTVEDADSSEEMIVQAEARECDDFATFLADVTYPDNTVVTVGETFTKTWEIRNDGDCSWGLGYSLKSVSGNFSEVIPVEEPFPTVEPSQTIQISLVLTAPLSPGEVSGAWVIKRPEGDNVRIQNGENFDLWAIVNVVEGRAVFTGGGSRVLKDGMVCAQANADYNNKVFVLINAIRAENELLELKLNDQLTSAAWILSSDMACNGFYDHTGSDGSSLEDRIAAQGYLPIDTAESIYYGFAGIPDRAYDWWIKSSIDSSNILSSAFTEIGIAYALNPQTGASYYTVVFAVPEAEE